MNATQGKPDPETGCLRIWRNCSTLPIHKAARKGPPFLLQGVKATFKSFGTASSEDAPHLFAGRMLPTAMPSHEQQRAVEL